MRKITLFFLLVCTGPCFAQQADHKKTAVQVLSWMAGRQFSRIIPLFDSTMSAALDAGKLEQAWNGLVAQAGAFKKAGPPAASKKGGVEIIDQLCEFEKAAFVLHIGFNSKDRINTLLFTLPPSGTAYVDPPYLKKDAIEERDVVVRSGAFDLPGTLTLPSRQQKFPLVILVHGSGPNDRDETIGGIKVFRDLANGLASGGVAVLRYDKRTFVYGTKSCASIDSITVKEEVTDDAAAAFQFAKTIPGVDTTRIFLLGHSLGAMLMPRMAASINGLAGVIMMAGNARPLEDVYLDQVNYLLSADGNFSKEDRDKLGEVKIQCLRVKNLGRGNPFPPASDLPLNVNAKYWYDLNQYNQVEVAKNLKLPMLIVQGERDYQVTMTDFNLWKENLYYHKNVRFSSYPKLNHAFAEGEGKSKPEEYQKQANVPGYVIDDLLSFIKK
jgi:dienelactone hydrolase